MKRLLIALCALIFFSASANASTCYITEYASIPGNAAQVAQTPALRTQTVTPSGSSQSKRFTVDTKFVRIICDGIISYNFGDVNVVATTSDARLPADAIEYFGVVPLGYVAVITNT